jgi:hypothetical protein
MVVTVLRTTYVVVFLWRIGQAFSVPICCVTSCSNAAKASFAALNARQLFSEQFTVSALVSRLWGTMFKFALYKTAHQY